MLAGGTAGHVLDVKTHLGCNTDESPSVVQFAVGTGSGSAMRQEARSRKHGLQDTLGGSYPRLTVIPLKQGAPA